jgi:hypothetical protein
LVTFTLAFIVGVLILIFGVDLWLLVTRDYKATVSATLLKLAKGYPIVPFLFGVVMAHLFWVNEAAVIEAVEACEAKHAMGTK